jgi:outer membrane protein TolC
MSNSRKHAVAAPLALGLMLAGAPAASAQSKGSDVSDSPTLAALVEEALARNPDIRAAGEALRAARTRPAQASARRDPSLALTYTNDGWSPSLGDMPDANLSLMLSQDLPWPGKRRLRGEIASKEAERVEQQLARARLSVAASVRRAYAGLLQARALLELTREQAEVWRQIEGVARARYSVGQGNQQDVLRAQIELTRIGQALTEQEAEGAVRRAELNRLLDRDAEAPLETSDALAPATPAAPLQQELERLAAASPELRAARASVEAAKLLLDLARKEYRPDLTLLAGYMNRGGLDPMWQAGVAINLPLNRKRRASGVAEAEAQLRSAEAGLRSIELQLRYRTQERLAQLAAALETAALYRDGVVPQGGLNVEAAIASYQAGRVPFVAVLEALTTLYVDRITLLRLYAGSARIRASLDEASLESTSDLPGMAPAAMAPARGGAVTGIGGTGGGAMGSMSR